jgi:DNA-binding CsgD family transcriptional regulator
MGSSIPAAPIWYQAMQTDSRILGVIERLYAAAAGLEAWDEAVASLAVLLEGGHAALHLIGSGGNLDLTAYSGLDGNEQTLFRSPEATELFAPFAAMLPLNTAISTFHLWSEREYENSALYNEVIRPANGFYGAGVIGLVPSGPFHLSVCRPRNDRDFDADEVGTLQTLLPHIATAVELSMRLRIASEGYATMTRVLDRLDSGVILADARGVPVYANAKALSIVAEADGLGLNGGLTATTPEATRQLRVAFAQVASDSASEPVRLALDRPSHRPPLQLAFLPIRRLGAVVPGSGSAAVAIFLTAPGASPSIERQMVADAFRLTRRESEVAVRLAEGQDLATIASELGIRVAAARQYLKRVFDKTGVHNRAALVALIRGFAEPWR